jgi:hypothetical protein
LLVAVQLVPLLELDAGADLVTAGQRREREKDESREGQGLVHSATSPIRRVKPGFGSEYGSRQVKLDND